MADGGAFQELIDRVRERVDVAQVVGHAVALNKGLRGKCPFHGSKSDSFAVLLKPKKGGRPYATCYGCGWHGDAIRFVADFYHLEFADALARLEADHGLDGLEASPVRREKRAPPPRSRGDRPRVDPIIMGQWIWNHGKADLDALRTWFAARGVPAELLTADRLRQLRFCPAAPIVPWEEGRKADSVPRAPAIAALIRRPREWAPIGLHVTFLAADLKSKLEHRRRDGTMMAARKMMGDPAGAVVLGRLQGACPLFVGEGLETVFSGMGLCGAQSDAVGLAVLSLGNLQGDWLRWKNGVTPLFDIRPNPQRPALAFAHEGAVTGLVDADMKPLRGPKDPETGQPRGLPVVEHRSGPVVHRAITTAERAMICADLFVKNWRAAGSRRVGAKRPPMGQDFNDAARAVAA